MSTPNILQFSPNDGHTYCHQIPFLLDLASQLVNTTIHNYSSANVWQKTDLSQIRLYPEEGYLFTQKWYRVIQKLCYSGVTPPLCPKITYPINQNLLIVCYKMPLLFFEILPSISINYITKKEATL